MEIVFINNNNIEQFEALMGGVNAAAVCFDRDTFGMGLIQEQEVYGEIVVQIKGNAAVIRSLYMVPAHRREGGATLLLLEASAYAGMRETVDGFTVEFTENLQVDNGLKAFFEYCGFDLTEHPDSTTYRLTLQALLNSPYFKEGGTDRRLKTYAQLSHDEKQSLMQEPPFYMPMYVQVNLIEPDVSFFLTENGKIHGCIVIVPEQDGLSVVWMKVLAENYRILMDLMQSAGKAAMDKYEGEKPIILPIISREANRLAKKLFGDSLVRVEKNYTGTMVFEEDE